MHEMLSFFTQSSSPNWVKDKTLCVLCVSVVRKNQTFRYASGVIILLIFKQEIV